MSEHEERKREQPGATRPVELPPPSEKLPHVTTKGCLLPVAIK